MCVSNLSFIYFSFTLYCLLKVVLICVPLSLFYWGGVLIGVSCGLLCSRSAVLRFTSPMAPRKAAVTVV